MLQRSYYEFLLEKRENEILELLNESVFIMSSKMGDIIEELVDNKEDYSKIAKCFYLLDMEDIDTKVSYLDLGDDNSSITFLDPDKVDKIRDEKGWTVNDVYRNVKGNSIKVGRLARKVIELYVKYKKPKGSDFNFTDQDIEKFVNAYKSQYDFSNNIMDSFSLVSGDDIKDVYLDSNYYNEDGTLGGSCMRDEDCQDYFRLYTDSSVNLLVLKSPNKKIMGRAVIWTLMDGSKFMDRVYTNRDSDVDLFIKYAKENGFTYKNNQNSLANTKFLTPDDDYSEPKNLKLESKVYKFRYDEREDANFPYMDTMKYLYWREGVVRNYTTSGSYYVCMEDTDGGCDCNECNGDGKSECESCHGRGSNDCDSCDGNGWTNCEECDGQGSYDCSECDGRGLIDNGETECDKCSGNGYVDCDKCSASGHIDCDDCNTNGSMECEDCEGEGNASCSRCGGFSNKWD